MSEDFGALSGPAKEHVVAVSWEGAVESGPVALASTIFNSKPLFIFAFSALAARIAPGFLIHEKSTLKLLIVRAVATLLVVAGLVIMLL